MVGPVVVRRCTECRIGGPLLAEDLVRGLLDGVVVALAPSPEPLGCGVVVVTAVVIAVLAFLFLGLHWWLEALGVA